MCRQEFCIPPGGVDGFPHHFIVQQLVEMTLQRGNTCDKHKDKEVELYCYNCNENICMKCYATTHDRAHTTGEIAEVAKTFKQRIADDDTEILSAISSVREQTGQPEEDVTGFHSEAERVEELVHATGEEVQRAVESQINDVLMKLQSVTAESVEETYEVALVKLESFHAYSRELLDKGRPSDITRAGCELHDRATELLNAKYRPPHVTFTPVDVTQVKRLNLIGKLTVSTEEPPGMNTSYMPHSYCQPYIAL